MKKTLVSTGLALATSLAFGAVSENFNEASSLPTGWTGDGAIEAEASPATGKMLAVDGTVTCENSGTAAATAKSTFLIKIPDDAVSAEDLNSVEGLSGCQTAVAAGEADTDGKLKLMVYCGATPAWTATGVTVAKGAWVNVELNLDYTAKMVQVKVGGAYATTGKATTKEGETSTGAWYPLAKSISGTTAKVGSLLFVGSSKVDDVTIAEIDAVPTADLPKDIENLTLDPVVLNQLGVTLDDIKANAEVGTSGLTVQQKLECGLDPTDNSKFTAQAITPAADGKVAVVVPYAFNNGQKYTVVMTDETGASTETVVDPVLDNVNKTATLTVKPGSGKVLKIQVKAAAPAAAK